MACLPAEYYFNANVLHYTEQCKGRVSYSSYSGIPLISGSTAVETVTFLPKLKMTCRSYLMNVQLASCLQNFAQFIASVECLPKSQLAQAFHPTKYSQEGILITR